MTQFSNQQNVGDVCLPCQQANLFYCDMPQSIQDRAGIVGIVNGLRTPTLPVGETYHLLNSAAGTTGELALEVRGQHIPLIPDLDELGRVNRAEDLKVLVGAERPDQALVTAPRISRLDHAKQLLRTRSIGGQLSILQRIEEIERIQAAGLGDADHDVEMYNLIRMVEERAGQYYFMPAPDEMVVIEMERPLPPGSYDISTASEEILDGIGDAMLGPFDESFDSILNLLERGGDLVLSQLPTVFIEYAIAMNAVENIANQEVRDVLSQGGRGGRASGSLLGDMRRSNFAREQFKRDFIRGMLKMKVVHISLFKNGKTVLGFRPNQYIRTAYGRFRTRTSYKTSLFESASRLSTGRISSVIGGAFRGFAAIGVALVVISEISEFLSGTEQDWTDLFVGLGFEMAKIAVSTLIGAAFTAVLIAMGAITGPLWMIITLGIGMSMAIGIMINVSTDSIGLKDNLRRTANDMQGQTRAGQPVAWQ